MLKPFHWVKGRIKLKFDRLFLIFGVIEMGVFEFITLIFIIMKVCGVVPFVHWGWWKVFSPEWVGYGCIVILLVLWAAFLIIFSVFSRD